jgi:hypothetical protein
MQDDRIDDSGYRGTLTGLPGWVSPALRVFHSVRPPTDEKRRQCVHELRRIDRTGMPYRTQQAQPKNAA